MRRRNYWKQARLVDRDDLVGQLEKLDELGMQAGERRELLLTTRDFQRALLATHGTPDRCREAWPL